MSTSVVLKDRYEIERELGRGGMSVVYLARDRQLLSKRVVVKELLEESFEDAWIRKKFQQEMEALARIDHPSVVGVLDTGETPEGKPFLVMQYVEGVPLRNVLEPGGMNFAQVAGIVRQIGQALAAAHEQGVWHRDLKPENIMLQSLGDGQEHVKLIDFGIAGIRDSAFSGEKTKVAGSTAYMAPEQFAGEPSAASDTYALGVIAYEMLTGERPFALGSLAHLVSDQARAKSPKELRTTLSTVAAKSILKAISFEPRDRYARIEDFSEELFQALTSGRISTVRKLGYEGALQIAHVLFIDLAGYSLLSTDRQKEYLAQLQRVVRESPSFCAAEADNEIISLPAGDGVALAFFGDPTLPAQCALEVTSALKSCPHLKLRMGIHSGPVHRVADVNANAKVAGGGINTAQTVMDCGDAGHILISKSVADVLLQLSQWAPYVTDLGERAFNNGATVHLFNLCTAEAGNPHRPQKLAAAEPKQQPAPRRGRTARAAGLALAVIAIAAGAWYWHGSHQPTAEELRLDYSMLVQRVRDGKPYGDPFRVPGEMVFEKDYGIALQVASPHPGYLYILNEGIAGDTGKRTLNLLEPRGAASAARPAAGTVRIPPSGWFRFDTATGKETCYLIWAKEPVPELELVKVLPAAKGGVVVIADAGQVKKLEAFLTKNAGGKVKAEKNEQARQTELRTPANLLVHAIRLEHQ